MPREAAFIQIGRLLICITIGGMGVYWSVLNRSWFSAAYLLGMCLMAAYLIYKAAKIIRETGRPANRDALSK